MTVVAVPLGVAAVSCLAGVVLSAVRNRRVSAGLAAAETVWRRGWYCRWCAVVFFQPTEEPFGIPQGQMLSPREFRQLVWSVGGYPEK